MQQLYSCLQVSVKSLAAWLRGANLEEEGFTVIQLVGEKHMDHCLRMYLLGTRSFILLWTWFEGPGPRDPVFMQTFIVHYPSF